MKFLSFGGEELAEINIYNYNSPELFEKRTSFLSNGFFPKVTGELLRRGKSMYFLSRYNLEIANMYYPEFSCNLHLVSPLEGGGRRSSTPTVKYIVYEGHTNFFSGIDISTKLISRIVTEHKMLNSYILTHVEPGVRLPVQFTADFDYHIHDTPMLWEEFYSKILKDFKVCGGKEVCQLHDVDPKNVLIINCSTSYHQPFFYETMKLLRGGAMFFGSSRNPYKDYFGKRHVETFDAATLRNWSPFHKDSYINLALEERLYKLLAGRFCFV